MCFTTHVTLMVLPTSTNISGLPSTVATGTEDAADEGEGGREKKEKFVKIVSGGGQTDSDVSRINKDTSAYSPSFFFSGKVGATVTFQLLILLPLCGFAPGHKSPGQERYGFFTQVTVGKKEKGEERESLEKVGSQGLKNSAMQTEYWQIVLGAS